MKITILPREQTITVDGETLAFAFPQDPNVLSIRWDGERGYIERSNGRTIAAQWANVQPYLDLFNAATRERAKAARAVAVGAITVTVGDKVFDGDETSQTRMSRAIIGMQAAGVSTMNWTLADNTSVEVTIAELTTALILAGQQQAALWPLP